MQCPSCGFQNLPGLNECARCAGMLSFEGIDVEPYRHSQGWVRLRHLRWRRRNLAPFINRCFDYLRREWDRSGLGARSRGPNEPTGGERFKWIAGSIIPGLGHLLVRDKRRGAYLLIGFGLALLCSLLFMSSIWTTCIAVMLAIHTYAIVDATFRRSPFARWQPMVVSLMVLPLLLYGVYQPVGWLMGGLAQLDPINGGFEGGAVEPGDVLLTPGRWFNQPGFSVGDVVSYHMPERSGNGWYTRGGVSIDRILAGPGDRVSIRSQQIYVNGKVLLVAARPLGMVHNPRDWDLVVPPGSWFIFPSLARLGGHYGANGDLLQMEVLKSASVVPADRVRGRVIAIANPIRRMRRF